MALELDSRYPGRFNPGNASYPQGSFKNRTAPGALDGSYLEKDWANDKEGFFQRMMLQAGISANGSVDTALSSQYYDAFLQVIQDNSPDYLNTARIDVASASNVNLSSLAPNTRHIRITGTATINSFTIESGSAYFVTFQSAPTLANSASIVTNTGANLIAVASDSCIIRATAANTVEVICYSSAGNNSGMVGYFARNSAPSGWLKANGAAVSRTTYAALFSAIGTTFGAGNGSTTFNLPDLRGEFVRGWDDGRGVDSGRAFGSAQLDELKSHQHDLPADIIGGADRQSLMVSAGSDEGFSGTNLSAASGGTETRPRNIALLACIKY
ncbi:phage tail protein [Pseudomonas sp.]|uniref:phage tail protein n=1 Tax=Pseudomonas sp. TaxID=306 RepID=UPI002586715C|nr:phage tail protein [Pseudomonas sp.]